MPCVTRAPLTAAELIEHPEFEQVLYNLPPAQKDKLAVAQGRGGPFNIVYEVHGHGRIHVVVRLDDHSPSPRREIRSLTWTRNT